MNTYETVFLNIKKFSTGNVVSGVDNINNISKESGISEEHIETYLDILERMRLVKYNLKDEYIKLTEVGEQTNNVF